MNKLKSYDSPFKFSSVRRANYSAATARFTLLNMGALARKFDLGEKEVLLKFIEEISAAYLLANGIMPPEADYTPPPEQDST